MLRNIIAVVIGMVVGMAVNMGVIMLNATVLYPMPAGLDMNNPEQMSAYVATLPVAALLVVIVAHLGQSFFGAWAAARIGASHVMVLATIIGVLSLVGGIINMTQIQGPTWMYIEMPLYLVVAWAAGAIEVKRRAKVA